MAEAIKRLVVRGAPAIGIAAAYGLAILIQKANTMGKLKEEFEHSYQVLKSTRPTAVNLFWALERIKNKFIQLCEQSKSLEEIKAILFEEAVLIENEDFAMCRQIGAYAYTLMENLKQITAMTICNAGGLATSGYGTALAGFYMAKEKGKEIEVFSLETRPLLQGSRLTCHELLKNGIKTTLLTDNMAGYLMQVKKIDLIIVGADRIAKNGDTANKIGTYQLAILAHAHQIPFYVAAPTSTLDTALSEGSQIPIEFRDKQEVLTFQGVQSAPLAVNVFSPAFDVTPAKYITGIITNKGIYHPPYSFKIED
jgi:methylthioribose-1-phosphate isomerase